MPVNFLIDPAYQPLFAANGLNSFNALMYGPLGEMISSPTDRRKLFRVALADSAGRQGRFYLKRMTGEPVWWLLKPVFFGRRPHCGPFREWQMLTALAQAGFSVMQPVAWGEVRRFGMPAGGFLVVAEVKGRDVAALAATLPVPEKLALLREVGALIGRLHAAGFFQPVRFKDLILEDESGRLVLIDRETSKPWAGSFSPGRAVAALARAARRTMRDGHRFGPAGIRSFLLGYTSGVASRWSVNPWALCRDVFARLRKDLN